MYKMKWTLEGENYRWNCTDINFLDMGGVKDYVVNLMKDIPNFCSFELELYDECEKEKWTGVAFFESGCYHIKFENEDGTKYHEMHELVY